MKTSFMIFTGLVLLMAVVTVRADYPIDYTAEAKENCIKFEDAVFYDAGLYEYVDAGLGEEGVVETDEFAVQLDDGCDAIDVCIKSGKIKDCGTIVPGSVDSIVLRDGAFTVELEFYDYGLYIFAVTSDDDNKTAALSYIEFCFCEDRTVVGWDYNPNRDSPNTAPGVEEEEEEELDVD